MKNRISVSFAPYRFVSLPIRAGQCICDGKNLIQFSGHEIFALKFCKLTDYRSRFNQKFNKSISTAIKQILIVLLLVLHTFSFLFDSFMIITNDQIVSNIADLQILLPSKPTTTSFTIVCVRSHDYDVREILWPPCWRSENIAHLASCCILKA